MARLLDVALDLGVTFVDTADMYGSTASERWLGEAMQGRSHRFVVATKSGLARADLPGPLRPLNQPTQKLLQRAGRKHNLDPRHVRHSIEASLMRLRRERIEFYFLHSPPTGIERRDDLFEVLDEALAAGKIGMYGVSSPDPAVISAVSQVRGCAVGQTAVNPQSTDALVATLESIDKAESLDLIANHVFMARTLLSALPPKNSSQSLADLLRKIDSLSKERGLSKAHLLLRHAAAVPRVRVVLSGTSNPSHLTQNVVALAAPATPEDLLT